MSLRSQILERQDCNKVYQAITYELKDAMYYKCLHLIMSSHKYFGTLICQKLEKAQLIQMHKISEEMWYMCTVISYHREVYEHQAQEN